VSCRATKHDKNKKDEFPVNSPRWLCEFLTQIMQHKARRYCYDIIFNICNTICVIDPFFR
jgi:hypothetical protein